MEQIKLEVGGDRHKWSELRVRKGMPDICQKCGCIKEVVAGKITYFLNDTLTEKAPKCEGQQDLTDYEAISINPRYSWKRSSAK